MVKKVRLLNDDGDVATEDTAVATDASIDNEQLMKYLEAIDWKLWEILKLARKHLEE